MVKLSASARITGDDPWIFTVKCTILDIWVSDNVIIACTFIVLNTIWMQLSHNNIIYLIFFFSYYPILMPIACFILPTIIPVYCWGETLKNAWFVAAMFRWTFVLNVTWLVNSAAHLYGDHPYDKYVLWLYLFIRWFFGFHSILSNSIHWTN